MIKGIHGLFYSSKPEELRAFIRDKLKLPFSDTGGGWLIFDFQEGDLGVHPTDGDDSMSGEHNISFFTDDIDATVAELKGRGVKLDDEVADHGYGLVTHLMMPGGVRVQIYQPKYAKRAKMSAAPKTTEVARRSPKTKPAAKAKAKRKRGRK